MIIGRQGIPLRERSINVISLVLEGDTDRMGSLTGKLGRASRCKGEIGADRLNVKKSPLNVNFLCCAEHILHFLVYLDEK